MFLNHGLETNVVAQDLSLLETASVELKVKHRFRLTAKELKLIRPMLKKQNFDLVLALNSCLEAEQIDYLSLWNKVRAQRKEFESASLKGLTPRQAVVLRTARLDFESRVLELWQGMFLETLGPVLELNWLQTSLIEKLLQRDHQLRMRSLLNVALSWEKLERSWNELSEQFEKQLEAILSADQCRNYRELTTRNNWLIAE